MGVDIYFYERADLTDEHEPRQESCYDDGHVLAFTLEGQEHALVGLEPERCYATSGEDAHISQAYHNYNRYREVLCYSVLGLDPREVWEDWLAHADKPFYNQINFADNEGVIGPVASRALADDYAQRREEFVEGMPSAIEHYFGQEGLREYDRQSAYYLAKYDEYAKGFALAADTGLVEYH